MSKPREVLERMARKVNSLTVEGWESLQPVTQKALSRKVQAALRELEAWYKEQEYFDPEGMKFFEMFSDITELEIE